MCCSVQSVQRTTGVLSERGVNLFGWELTSFHHRGFDLEVFSAKTTPQQTVADEDMDNLLAKLTPLSQLTLDLHGAMY